MFDHVLVHAREQPVMALGQAPPGLLSPAEEVVLAGLTMVPRRRKWLLGRWAAKRLLGELGVKGTSIFNDGVGVPYIVQEDEARSPISLSISHRGEWGLAAVARAPGVTIGADLETVEPRDPAFVRQFFSEAEAEQVAKAGSEHAADLLVARIWSAKEAVLKVMGIGLRHDTRDIMVGDEIAAPAGVTEDWRGLEVRLAPVLETRVSPRSLTLLWRDLGSHVITVALLRSTDCS